jgi:hypothetical protein
MGVGNLNTTLDFYETADNAYGGFTDTKRNEVKNVTKVQVVRLDDLIEKLEVKQVDFVKIDVEGFESEVLDGMKRTIEKYKPIIFCEIHGENKANPDPAATLSFMADLGYTAFALESGELRQTTSHDGANINYIFAP